MFIIILIVIAIIIGVALIGSYNNLVKLRMRTTEAWSQIDVQLKRRNDLIPNLVETVKGYSKYEEETLTKVIEMRSKITQASNPTEKMQASDELSRQVNSILAIAESYPDLKASTNYLNLQEELTNTENKISYSRQLYNSTTANYNMKIETFPTNLIAGMFGFKKSDFLEASEKEIEVPKVNFGS